MSTISRREHLLSLAGLSVMAGCASDETNSDSTQPQSQSEQSDTSPDLTSSEGENPVETVEEASIEIANVDLVFGDSVLAPTDGQIPWGLTKIENASSVPHGRVKTELRFYDSDDTFIEKREGYTEYIPADTVWIDYNRFSTDTPEQVDYVEARIADSDPIVDGRVIEDTTIISSEMAADPESGVEFAAEIDLNGANPDRVTVIGSFYDAQDRFRGAIRSVETNPAGTVAASPNSIFIRTPPNLEDQQVTSHEITVLSGSI